VPASPATAKGTFGIVTDLAGARESLSGRLAGGQDKSSEFRVSSCELPNKSGEIGDGRSGPVEEFRDEVVRETRDERREERMEDGKWKMEEQRAERPRVEEFRDEAAPESRRADREAPRHGVEEFRDETMREAGMDDGKRNREAKGTKTPRATPVEEFRDESVSRPRERREERTERPAERERAPREDSRHRGNGADGEHRHATIALMPDPANDPAPRRLRTESAMAAPARDYAPSRAGKVPDKTIAPERRERSPERGGSRPKAHATIDVRVKSGRSDTGEKGKKGGGIFGFIKRALGFGEVPQVYAPGFEPDRPAAEEDEESGERKHHESHHATGRDGEGSGEGRRRRRRRRGGRGRHSDGQEPGSEGHRHHGDI